MGTFHFFISWPSEGEVYALLCTCAYKVPTFGGFEFEKWCIEEVAAGLVICAALRRGKNDGKNELGLDSLWNCNPAAFVNS